MSGIRCVDKEGRIMSSVDYACLYDSNGKGKFSLNIFSPLKPIVNDGNLSFLTGEFMPKILDISSSSEEIVKLWDKFESDGFPMEDLSQSYYVAELRSFFASGVYPSITLVSDLILLITCIERCRNMTGFEQKYNRDKIKIQQLIKSRNSNPRDLKSNLTVCEKISHIENEYMIAYNINSIHPVEFTNDKGTPDLKVKNKNILIDTKMRFVNDKPIMPNPEKIDATIKTIFSLLMKDGFAPMVDAFDKQNADIAMINLNKTAYGFTLATGLIPDSNLESSVNSAFKMVEENEKAVIFYNLSKGTINNIFVLCFKRNVVEEIGRNLDRIDKLLIKGRSKMNFSQFATFVNEMGKGLFD